ncbi:MAG: FAD-dependent oxidoreductase, partial [Pseudomonadota bacterium]
MGAGKPLVIVGASYAGVQLAASARELGFEERIVLIGDETHAPYQRPPLSKGLLTGKTTVDKLALRGPDFFAQNNIELLLGRRATTLDAGAQTLALDDGGTLDYGWLALMTGARCRPFTLPGAALEGVLNLRTLDDALRVEAAAAALTATGQRACVIGGGFIGLEVAAALRSRGIEVTVIEAQPHLLTRSFPPAMSAYVENAHRHRGIELLTGHAVRALHGEHGRVVAVELEGGRRIDCGLVVLGIGVLPNTELAQQAGIAVENGIVVDMLGRTSAPHVLAAGDVANMALPAAPGAAARMRLESIQAANDGARAVASLLVGREQPCTAVPWFWSDQFELKFQMAGLPAHGDEVVLRGDMASDRFSVFYLRQGTLAAAHTVNKPAEHMQSRKLIGARVQLTAAELADESFDLKRVPLPV